MPNQPPQETWEDDAGTPDRFSSRLHDAITALLLLAAFPFGFALLALAGVFGRSLPRAAAAIVFLGALHMAAIVNILMGNTAFVALVQDGSGIIALLIQGVTALFTRV